MSFGLSQSDRDILADICAWWRGFRGVRPPAPPCPTPTPPQFVFGKLDDALAYNDSDGVALSIWTWSGSAWADSGENVTVFPSPLSTSGGIASGKWVDADYHHQSGRWYVRGYQC